MSRDVLEKVDLGSLVQLADVARILQEAFLNFA
jgi:hypothetical protein